MFETWVHEFPIMNVVIVLYWKQRFRRHLVKGWGQGKYFFIFQEPSVIFCLVISFLTHQLLFTRHIMTLHCFHLRSAFQFILHTQKSPWCTSQRLWIIMITTNHKIIALTHRSVTFDLNCALGMKRSDITFCLCLTAHACTWLISYHINPWQTMPKWDLI